MPQTDFFEQNIKKRKTKKRIRGMGGGGAIEINNLPKTKFTYHPLQL